MIPLRSLVHASALQQRFGKSDVSTLSRASRAACKHPRISLNGYFCYGCTDITTGYSYRLWQFSWQQLAIILAVVQSFDSNTVQHLQCMEGMQELPAQHASIQESLNELLLPWLRRYHCYVQYAIMAVQLAAVSNYSSSSAIFDSNTVQHLQCMEGMQELPAQLVNNFSADPTVHNVACVMIAQLVITIVQDISIGFEHCSDYFL
ncbi:hypothetical protein AB9K21_01705 [Anaplasma phagocytophilum]|uniref:Uncharacterized protein n=1 Tax=Anaplasma phagocytophilum str. ApNP TaxID=1359153 RepID=A0A0F3NDW0_ANAPH|nr:hypothetical protein APHNP_0368 [Anaplasma phagocytophilum str. ApNP]